MQYKVKKRKKLENWYWPAIFLCILFRIVVRQTQRSLENRLDKSNLKCKEAEHIQRTYFQIRARLQDEQKDFENTLDDTEREIRRYAGATALQFTHLTKKN